MTASPDMSFLQAFPGVSAVASENGYAKIKAPPQVVPAELLRAAVANAPVDHFEVVEPTLNDIYLHYVRPEEPVA